MSGEGAQGDLVRPDLRRLVRMDEIVVIEADDRSHLELELAAHLGGRLADPTALALELAGEMLDALAEYLVGDPSERNSDGRPLLKTCERLRARLRQAEEAHRAVLVPPPPLAGTVDPAPPVALTASPPAPSTHRPKPAAVPGAGPGPGHRSGTSFASGTEAPPKNNPMGSARPPIGPRPERPTTGPAQPKVADPSRHSAVLGTLACASLGVLAIGVAVVASGIPIPPLFREPSPSPPVLVDHFDVATVPAGTYELPVAEGTWMVTLSRGMLLGTIEVTQRQYRDVMGVVPNASATATTGLSCSSAGVGEDLPVTCVRWVDALRFCNLLTDRENAIRPEGTVALDRAYHERAGGTWECRLEATGYRLPTEAEWWVAALADRPRNHFSGSDVATEVACFDTDALCPAKSKAKNGWGFWDMSGNAMEWVWDSWSEALPPGQATDPSGPEAEGMHALRGGWYYLADDRVRADTRFGFRGDAVLAGAGFRVGRTLPPATGTP